VWRNGFWFLQRYFLVSFGLALVWQSIGNWEQACLMVLFHGCGSRSFVESARPGVYAKIRKAVIIGNPKSGDIIRLSLNLDEIL